MKSTGLGQTGRLRDVFRRRTLERRLCPLRCREARRGTSSEGFGESSHAIGGAADSKKFLGLLARGTQ